MSEFVLDASVAAKWFLNDERHVKEATVYLALMLADDIGIHAPELLKYEFGSILTRAQRDDGRPIGHDASLRAHDTFSEFPIMYHNLTTEGLRQALELANRFGCSFQDSCYLWLAQDLRCRLLTDDLKFVEALPPETVRDFVQLLYERR